MQLSETVHEVSLRLGLKASLKVNWDPFTFYEVDEPKLFSCLSFLKELEVGLPLAVLETRNQAAVVLRVAKLEKNLSLLVRLRQPGIRARLEEQLLENHGTFY